MLSTMAAPESTYSWCAWAPQFAHVPVSKPRVSAEKCWCRRANLESKRASVLRINRNESHHGGEVSTLSERKEAADLIHPLDIHCLRSFSRIAKLCRRVYMFFSANLFFLSLFSQCHRLEVGSDFFRLFHHLVLRVFCCTPGPPDGHVHLLTNLRRLAVDVVEKQIDVLNEAYAGATHAEDGHDTGIRFKLDEVRTRAFTAERCRGSFPPLPPPHHLV